jgi:predicted HAD superfamily Cof-like phosphohydrolase
MYIDLIDLAGNIFIDSIVSGGTCPPEEHTQMEKTIRAMAEKVDDFQRHILKVPYTNGLADRSRHSHLREEVDEIFEAHDNGDIAGVVDGLVDVIYVALGTLLQMGIPPEWPFDRVHEANMKKRGEKTERHEHDAVKPEDWQSPDIDGLLRDIEIFRQVSPVFIELTKLRIHKGGNYNRGTVKRSDHFPLGGVSFFQMLWMKSCRVRSLVESTLRDEHDNPETQRLISRELDDIIVYACFWAEFMRGLEI